MSADSPVEGSQVLLALQAAASPASDPESSAPVSRSVLVIQLSVFAGGDTGFSQAMAARATRWPWAKRDAWDRRAKRPCRPCRPARSGWASGALRQERFQRCQRSKGRTRTKGRSRNRRWWWTWSHGPTRASRKVDCRTSRCVRKPMMKTQC